MSFIEYYATSRAPMDCSEKHNKPSIVFPVLAEHCHFANIIIICHKWLPIFC